MKTAWLFTGPEIGQKKQRVQDLKKEISKKYGKVEPHVFYAYETNVFEIMNLLQTVSLFAAPTFIELKNAELIKNKSEIDKLQEWIKKSIPENLGFLVLESDEFSIDKRLEKAFDKGQKQIFWEMFENKKQDWIRSFFVQNKMSITNAGIDAILDLVENNTEALKNQCQHLVLFFEPGKKIEKTDIESLLSHNKNEDVFSLFDALTYNNTEKSFDILNKLLLTKSFSAVQFIIGLTYCFRRLGDVKNYLDKTGETPNDNNLRRFGITSKKAISQYFRALKLWSTEEIKKIIFLLTNCDLEIRKQGQALQNILLEITILKIAKKQLEIVKTT